MTVLERDIGTRAGSPDLAAGLSIADALCRNAIWSGGLCVFHGAIAPESLASPPRFATLGGDLYEGSAGIARFLLLAHRYSGEPDHLRTAGGALAHAMSAPEDHGLFTGRLGAALVALEAGPVLRDEACALVDDCVAAALADPDPAADLLSGLAGVIVGLEAAFRLVPEPRWLDAAFTLGRRLVRLGEGRVPGLAWPVHPGSAAHLCGLAHGASGVALAMTCLALHEPGEPAWERTAIRARDFERAFYAPEHGSWADLREDAGGGAAETRTHPHMWCHGSIGIAAERLGATDRLGRADRIAALEAVRSSTRCLLAEPRGPGTDDRLNGSVCHGLSGAADVLLDAALAADDPAPWRRLARAAAAALRDDARRPEGWRCGIPGGWACPGLMLGLAGIGWTQLRCHDPTGVPSVWRLSDQPPVKPREPAPG